jgi:hypothetical protein
MPFQKFWCRPRLLDSRQYGKGLAVQFIVVAPVLKFLADSAANLDFIVEGDGEVPKVEEVVQVGAQ